MIWSNRESAALSSWLLLRRRSGAESPASASRLAGAEAAVRIAGLLPQARRLLVRSRSAEIRRPGGCSRSAAVTSP